MSNFQFGVSDSFQEENHLQNGTFSNVSGLETWKCSFVSFEDFETYKKDPNGFEKLVQIAEEKIKDTEANLNKNSAEIEEKMIETGKIFLCNF